MQTPVDWQAEARKMRARGKGAAEIAAELGQTVPAVREALRGTRRTPPADGDARSLGAGQAMIEPHQPRAIRPVLDQNMVRSAAADFAAGRITRSELMKKITR